MKQNKKRFSFFTKLDVFFMGSVFTTFAIYLTFLKNNSILNLEYI
jgi:hypothetical protein